MDLGQQIHLFIPAEIEFRSEQKPTPLKTAMAFVQRDSLLLALKAGCTAGVGLVAGSALYINVVEVPCALDYDAEHALQCWNSNFKRGKKFGVSAFLLVVNFPII